MAAREAGTGNSGAPARPRDLLASQRENVSWRITLFVPAGWNTVTVTVSNVVVAIMRSGHGFSASVVTEKVARPFFTRRSVSEPSETVSRPGGS